LIYSTVQTPELIPQAVQVYHCVVVYTRIIACQRIAQGAAQQRQCVLQSDAAVKTVADGGTKKPEFWPNSG
jgi:hypothetical protein